jgi:hypothetical protein
MIIDELQIAKGSRQAVPFGLGLGLGLGLWKGGSEAKYAKRLVHRWSSLTISPVLASSDCANTLKTNDRRPAAHLGRPISP